jgi:hypothetical protein
MGIYHTIIGPQPESLAGRDACIDMDIKIPIHFYTRYFNVSPGCSCPGIFAQPCYQGESVPGKRCSIEDLFIFIPDLQAAIRDVKSGRAVKLIKYPVAGLTRDK